MINNNLIYFPIQFAVFESSFWFNIKLMWSPTNLNVGENIAIEDFQMKGALTNKSCDL